MQRWQSCSGSTSRHPRVHDSRVVAGPVRRALARSWLLYMNRIALLAVAAPRPASVEDRALEGRV